MKCYVDGKPCTCQLSEQPCERDTDFEYDDTVNGQLRYETEMPQEFEYARRMSEAAD